MMSPEAQPLAGRLCVQAAKGMLRANIRGIEAA